MTSRHRSGSAGATCLLVGAALAFAGLVAPAPTPARDGRHEAVVVRGHPGASAEARRAVERLGGEVGRRLAIVDGFAAEVPAGALARLAASPAVLGVAPDRRLWPLDAEDAGPEGGYDPDHDPSSMVAVAQEITGAAEFWNDRYTGAGVDVALVDSGVVPVDGLRTPGKVLHGPDLSFESQSDEHRHLDTYGHGTHMAGIIAGRADAVPAVVQRASPASPGWPPTPASSA